MAPTIAADKDGSSSPAEGGGRQVKAVPDATRRFVADYCARCHNEEHKRGNLDLKPLAYDPADRGNFALWVKVHDRVAAGEMPPDDVKQPEGSAREAFAGGLADRLVASERRRLAGEGRATQRRMNRFEYENALRDLLGVPMAQIASQLPQDGEANRYNKSAEALARPTCTNASSPPRTPGSSPPRCTRSAASARSTRLRRRCCGCARRARRSSPDRR